MELENKNIDIRNRLNKSKTLAPVVSNATSGVADELTGGEKSHQYSLLPETPPGLPDYTDFRFYLKDFYSFRRRETAGSIRPYSYATFSAAANIRSPNYLKMIIEGQRNLSAEMVKKFSQALQLSKEGMEEFAALVSYGQSVDPMLRNQKLKLLNELRAKRQIKAGVIEQDAWDKIPNWITWVLYALAEQKEATFDYDRLFQILKGMAIKDDIRKSLGKLVQSGDLVIDPMTGEIRKGRELMSGTESIPVELIRKIQTELVYLGLEAMFKEKPQDREIGTMTAALTEEEFDQLKFELRQFRKRWVRDISARRKASKGDRVFQLNIQLFPLTASCEQAKKNPQ